MPRARGTCALLLVFAAGCLSACYAAPIVPPKPPVYRSPNPSELDRTSPWYRSNPNDCEPCARPGRANPSEPTGTILPPAPPVGSNRWDVVGDGGARRHGETVPTTEPWIWIDPDGKIRARIPPSAETRAATDALRPSAAVTVQHGR